MKGNQPDLFAQPRQFDLDPPVRKRRKDLPGQRYIVPHRDLTSVPCPSCGASCAILELPDKETVLLDLSKMSYGSAPAHKDVCQKREK